MRQPWIKALAVGAALGAVFNSYFVYAAWQSVAPHGSADYLMYAMLLVIPLFFSLLVALIGLIGLATRYRRRCFHVVVMALAFFLVGLAVARLGGIVRMAGFHKLAERSAPLIVAIEDFTRAHGSAPPSLEALVPDFLPAVPGTQIGAYPRYAYHVGAAAAPFDNNPWVLMVETPYGGTNQDLFLYLPSGNYRHNGYGGKLERVADWGYVHE